LARASLAESMVMVGSWGAKSVRLNVPLCKRQPDHDHQCFMAQTPLPNRSTKSSALPTSPIKNQSRFGLTQQA